MPSKEARKNQTVIPPPNAIVLDKASLMQTIIATGVLGLTKQKLFKEQL